MFEFSNGGDMMDIRRLAEFGFVCSTDLTFIPIPFEGLLSY